jgi:TrmH family RNA methyltransferase
VRSVRALSGRSARLRTRRFVAEGPQAVREAVAAGIVRDLYTTPEAAERHHEIIQAALTAGATVRSATAQVLAAMADTVTPQGLLAVCTLVDVPLDRVLAARPLLVAVLAQVRDPGNAGTVIRAADAAGADAVLLTDASVEVHNPKCVRASAGSLFHLPVVTGVPLAEATGRLRAAGLTLFAADGAGELDLDDLADAACAGDRTGLAGPTAWLFGNEAWGLPVGDRALADATVRVPLHGRAESLNLAAAATVCLYASARAQRRSAGCRLPDRHEKPPGGGPVMSPGDG